MNEADASRHVAKMRDWMRRAALSYLERYASSEANLARVLRRKAHRRLARIAAAGVADTAGGTAPEPAVDEATLGALIERTVADLRDLGLVDDQAFAETKVASARRKGQSRARIGARLAAKGVDRDTAAAALAADDTDDDRAALLLARRKRLGPFRTAAPADPRDADRRDLAALCRAGFAYALARKVIALDRQTAEDRLSGEA